MQHLKTAALLAVVAWSLTACPGGGIAIDRDVVYGVGFVEDPAGPGTYTTKNLLLDAYYPVDDSGTDKPAIILIHGGTFQEGSKEKEEIVEFAQYFARRGFVAFSIDYRKTGDKPPAPDNVPPISLFEAAHAAFVDTKAAIRWVRANSAVYGIDPNMIVVLGDSAGAFAALTAAVTDPQDYASDGTNFPVPPSNYPQVSPAVQGCIDLWGSADHVLLKFDRNDPPMMIVHGEDDDNFFTPFGAAQRIHGLCELLDIPHEFYPIEDAGHGAWDARVNGKDLRRLAYEFVQDHVLNAAR